MRNNSLLACFILVVIWCMLASCTSDNILGETERSTIQLSVNESLLLSGKTRGSIITTESLDQIGLFGIRTPKGYPATTGYTNDFIYNSLVTKENEWQTEYSWPGPSNEVALFAYAPYKGGGLTFSTKVGYPEIYYEIPNDASTHPDLVVDYRAGLKGDYIIPVKVELEHVLCRVVVGCYNKPIESIKLKYIKDKGAYQFGTGWTVGQTSAGRIVTHDFSYPLTADPIDPPYKVTFMVLPQTVPDIGEIEISFADGSPSQTRAIGGDVWKEGETYEYNFCYDVNPVEFSYIGCRQAFMATEAGTYMVECWGAQGGGDNSRIGGYGGYTKGNIYLEKGEKLYVYVGGSGNTSTGEATPVFNNGTIRTTYPGATYTFAGGGATDIRLSDAVWNDFESLKTRIMVAAGGGGAISYHRPMSAGAAGGLTGYSGGLYGKNGRTATGGQQTIGGLCGLGFNTSPANGEFGYTTDMWGGRSGGGTGYYNGGCGAHGASTTGSGAGGSCFISGHNGCDAIDESSEIDQMIHTGQSIHYSGKSFSSTYMYDGQGYQWTATKGGRTGFSSPTGTTETGHTGNGYCRITKL